MNDTDVKTIGECIDHILHEDNWNGRICWKKIVHTGNLVLY